MFESGFDDLIKQALQYTIKAGPIRLDMPKEIVAFHRAWMIVACYKVIDPFGVMFLPIPDKMPKRVFL